MGGTLHDHLNNPLLAITSTTNPACEKGAWFQARAYQSFADPADWENDQTPTGLTTCKPGLLHGQQGYC